MKNPLDLSVNTPTKDHLSVTNATTPQISDRYEEILHGVATFLGVYRCEHTPISEHTCTPFWSQISYQVSLEKPDLLQYMRSYVWKVNNKMKFVAFADFGQNEHNISTVTECVWESLRDTPI